MNRTIQSLAFALLASLLARQAAAQSVTLDQYRAAPTGRDGFVLSRPVGLGHLRGSASLQLDYALAPLVLQRVGQPSTPLVQHQLGAQVGVAIGLFDRFVVYARLPTTLVMTGQSVPGFPQAQGAGLGDLALGGRYVMLGDDGDPVALALEVEATAPTAAAAQSQQLLGAPGLTVTPRVLAEVRPIPRLRIQANLGGRFRDTVDFQSLRVGDALTWGLGASFAVIEQMLEARVEAWGSTGFAHFADPNTSPTEVLAGARLTALPGLVFGLAAGMGLGSGYGTPTFRGAFTVSWVFPEPATPSATRDGAGAGLVAGERTTDEPQTTVAESSQPEDGSQDGDAVADAGGEHAAATPNDSTGETSENAATGETATGETPTGETATGDTTTGDTATEGPAARYAALDRDGDHIPDAEDHCPLDVEDFDEIRDGDGCPEVDADEDGLADASDHCPLTPGTQRGGTCGGCPERACMGGSGGSIDIGERVEFETGSDVIRTESEDVLRDVVSIVGTNPQLRRIRVEGHTDSVGDDGNNLELSRRRAASVRRWMVAHGIEAERVEAWGCGEAFPLNSNEHSYGRRANRRVEFLIVDPPTSRVQREGCQPAD